MAVKFSNNFSTVLVSSISSSATVIELQSVSGLPTLGAGDYTYLTFDTDTNSPTIEIVKVTAINAGTNEITVVRGQDNTSASAFAAGTAVELRMCAILLSEFLQEDGDGSNLTDVRAETVEVNVKNVSGGSLAKGTPVHQTGTAGAATFEVVAADASNAALMPAHFVLLETLADEEEGRGLLMGRISGVDTSAFSEGDTIYVAAGGGYTNTAPTGEGNLIQNLGTVTRVDATNGGGEVMGAGRSAATPNLNDGNIFLGNASNQAAAASLSTSVSNLSHYNNANWDTAYGWGDHASAGYQAASTALTTSTTFGGDVSGTYDAIVIANDSHTHDGRYYTESEADSRFLNVAGDTLTGRLTFAESGYSISDDLHVWKRSYAVSINSPKELLYHDGNSLPDGGAYRFHAHIAVTGTDQSATAVFWNENGTWKVNVTYQSGVDSNHPEFIVGSNGKPHISIDHPSTYTIEVLGERLELGEGTGTDNKSGFGADAYMSEALGALRHNPNGGSDYTSGDRVFTDGYHPNADAWTTSRTLALSGDVTGSVSLDGSANATITTTIADDSHNHVIANVDGLQTALDAKLPSSSYTAADVLTKIKTVDGVGSGLDADLLDGQHGSTYLTDNTYLLRSDNRTISPSEYSSGRLAFGFTSWANNNTSPYADFLHMRSYTDSSGGADNLLMFKKDGIGMRLWQQTYGSTTAYASYADFWHSGNDGSGSGLDADTVDGIQGSVLLRSDTNQSIAYTSKTSWYSNTNGASTSGSQSSLEVYSPTANTDAFMTFHVSGDYAGYFGLDGTTNDLFWGGWSRGAAKYRIWHAANDGSGSGLDADLLDGLNSSQFLRSDTSDTISGNLTVDNGTSTTLSVKCDNEGLALIRANGDGQGTGAIEVGQADNYGGGISYNGDGSPAFVSGETSDAITFYRLDAGTRTEVFYYPYSSNDVVFNGSITSSDIRVNNANTALSQGSGNALRITTNSGYVDIGPMNGTYSHFSTDRGKFYFNQPVHFDGQIYNYIGGGTTDPYWRAGNDGSGSGLDADLLDGQHGSYYQPASTAITTGNIGSQSVSSASNIDGISFRNGNSSNGIGPDYVQENGTGYINSVSLFGQTDGALYSQAYSTAWVHQIFGDYRTGNLAVRGRLNGTWQSWKTVWTSANDGSGSGLDADTVDGLNSSSFLRSDTQATSSASLILANNWGQGTYNGQFVIQGSNPSWETRGNSSQPYGWLHHQDGSGNYTLYSIAGYTGNSWTQRFTFNHGDQTFRNGGPTGNVYYHQGNDGSGSGLDADLLDGLQGDFYFKSATNNNGGWSQSNRNFSVRTGGNSVGLHMEESDGTFGFQIYGDGSSYGFLDGEWADWDLKKITNGELYVDAGSGLQKVWHAGNDGSGSGLDADLLDGKDHTNFGATLATYGTTAGASGRIRCTAPFNTNSAHMFQVTVTIYSNYGQHTYVVGGYMYPTTNQWYSPTCVYSGTGTPDIVVGRDANGRAYISIANGNYAGVRVHNMTRGYQTSLSDTYDPWTITIDGATENSVPVSLYKTWNSGNDGSGSGLDADTVDGLQASQFLRSDAVTIMSSTGIGRNDHHRGHLIGSYNNVGDNSSKTNPIYSIGSAYIPAAASLSGFYGLGFSHPNFWGSGKTAGWGIYTTDNGTITFTAGYNGSSASGIGVWSRGTIVSDGQGTLWGSSNDGSGSGLDADTCDGQHLGTTSNPTFNTVRTPGANAEVKFSVWSGTTYGIGMQSGVTYGGLNDYAMTFCMNNDSDRGFWWGYSGQAKSAGAMSLTTGGILTVASSITAGGNITAYSDRRLKEDLRPITDALSKVQKLSGNTYTRNDQKDTETRYAGLIAQECAAVLPESVKEADGGVLALDYNAITALLLESIRELKAEVDDLKAQLKEK